ncbi:Chloroplast import component protein (Tic20) [Symmachiella macrocystis]|uniref:Chloroplast import component protein (Tic20) n=1 Tax=Symmachiella macrocystis TaxID=2527985 RepID=A0A5C6BM15_9PLAN|nr:DUF4870 domain-containing protein [Symmachiella macrocystis]TWU12812.1 Chloroplast import component protein (Tic20) [Symmachiella macrocystis]
MATNDWENRDSGPVEFLTVTDDDKLWALLAHLSGLLVLVAAPANVIAPLILFVLYKDKNRYVAFHALQSLYFQLALIVIGVLAGILAFITLGIGLIVAIPVILGLAVAGIVYPIIVGLHAHRGEMYEYVFVGELARKHMDLY